MTTIQLPKAQLPTFRFAPRSRKVEAFRINVWPTLLTALGAFLLMAALTLLGMHNLPAALSYATLGGLATWRGVHRILLTPALRKQHGLGPNQGGKALGHVAFALALGVVLALIAEFALLLGGLYLWLEAAK